MICQPTLRGFGLLSRGNGRLRRSAPVRKLASAISHSSSSPSSCEIGSRARSFHLSAASAASGIKEFIPKWLRREEEEIDPEEILGAASMDMISAVAKPSEKFKADYLPPEDLIEKMEEICRQVLSPASPPSSSSSSSSFSALEFPDDRVKFVFLDRCVEMFQRRIPNSFVDDLRTVGDAVDFFSRPRLSRDRILERLRDDDATPKNVHVIPDYMTFEKEMELHEGRDVFPNQDIIVSSLREKGKYKSVRKPKCPWEEAQGFDLPVRYGRHKGF